MVTIVKKTYSPPPIDYGEIFRYAMCRREDRELAEIIHGLTEEASRVLSYQCCFGIFPVEIIGSRVSFPFAETESADLSRNLSGCKNAAVFAATVGMGLDRLILKYSRISPSKALLLQAIGAERIEGLCDTFCGELSAEYETRPRFSPGYGDLSLELQRDIFAVLNCSKHIGISLNDSLIITPSKSVTAIVGISG